MTRLDRLVLGEIIGPFVGSVFLFSSLILATGEMVRLAEYLQSGESVVLVAQLIAFTLPSIVSLTFPIAMLLATLLGIGSLSSWSELTAMVAAGASFERIMVPVAAFGLVVSLAGIWLTSSIVPRANAGRQNIIDTVEQRGGIPLAQGAFSYTIRDKSSGTVLELFAEGGGSLGERRANSATLHNVSIEFWQQGKLKRVIYANRADWVLNTQNWTLGGDIYGFDFTQTPDSFGSIIGADSMETRQEMPLGKPDELQTLKNMRVEDISTQDLRKRSRLFLASGDAFEARQSEVEAARRIALPFAAFVFALVGAPLGVRPPRSSRGVALGYAVFITFGYWILLQLFTVLGQGGTLPPALAVSIPNLLGLAVGLYLIRTRGIVRS